MADLNQPAQTDVLNAAPNSDIGSLDAGAIDTCIGLAGDYIYAKVTKYELPLSAAWGALKRMWAAMAASLCLNGTYPEIEDAAQADGLKRLVDAWLDAVNASETLTDDAGGALPLAVKAAGSLPQCSTAKKKPLFYRPEHSRITGEEPELTQETAATGIVEENGKDDY